jgi:N-methylhydantoinase A
MNVLGVDVGGTFTDAVLLEEGDVRTAKVPTARRQEESVLAAVAAVGAGEVERFTHGTTVATNALLERKGARTAFVATAGFEHLLHLRRQNRAHLYRLCAAHPEPLVPLDGCFGVRERMGPEGVLEPLDLDSLPELDASVEAVAVCLLFSFRDASHERAVAEELRLRLTGARVVASHEISQEFREYERASTAAVDAYLGPVVSSYLEALGEASAAAGLPQPLVMRSSGGSATLAEAAAHPAVAVVSGPAAGVVGAARAARAARVADAISFDMGGTSTDVCLIRGGEAGRSAEREVGGLPLRLPTVDLQTVGAGGGSIVWRDAGGAVRVGPESAGADPGPACYGRGGTRPTVTDANLLLGRLPPRLAGGLEVDREAAERAFDGLDPAEALEVVNAEMLRALRLVSVERGHDPRELALVAFGGAGPLHAAEVADSLEIPEVLVPPHPGITSAGGLLTSDLKYDQMRTVFQLQGSVDADRLNRELDQLETELRGWLERDGVPAADVEVIRALDCRYVGQGYELRVILDEGPFTEAALAQFHVLHEREYGSAYGDPIEIVNARVTAIGRRPALESPPVASGSLEEALVGESEGVFRVEGGLQALQTRFYDRTLLPLDETIPGPAVVFHPDTTTVVPPSWTATADASGNLILKKGDAR